MLKMSNLRLRRAMVRQHADEFERDAGRAEPQHVADAQRDAPADPFVVDERAVCALVLDDGLSPPGATCSIRETPATPAGSVNRVASRRLTSRASTAQSSWPGPTAKQDVARTASGGTASDDDAVGRRSSRPRPCSGRRCTREMASGSRTIAAAACNAPTAAAAGGSVTTTQSRSEDSRSSSPGTATTRGVTHTCSIVPADASPAPAATSPR